MGGEARAASSLAASYGLLLGLLISLAVPDAPQAQSAERELQIDERSAAVLFHRLLDDRQLQRERAGATVSPPPLRSPAPRARRIPRGSGCQPLRGPLGKIFPRLARCQ